MSAILKFVGLSLGILLASSSTVLDIATSGPFIKATNDNLQKQGQELNSAKLLDLDDYSNTEISGAELYNIIRKYSGDSDFGIIVELQTQSENATGIKSFYNYNLLMRVEDDDDDLSELRYAPPIIGDKLDTEKIGGVNSDELINCTFTARLITNENDAIVGVLFKEKV